MTLALDPDTGLSVATDAVERAMAAGATAAKAGHSYVERFEINFDTTEISLVRSTVTDGLSVTALVGERKGTADMTGRDHDGVDVTVAQALAAAKAAQPDPANLLPADPAEAAPSSGDAQPDKEAMVDAVARFLDVLRLDHPSVLSRASNYTFLNVWTSYANSHGRTQHARQGRYAATLVVSGRHEGSSTSFQYTSSVSAEPFGDLAAVPAFGQALRETEQSFDARPVPETFVGDVIVTPQALASLMGSVAQSLGGLALMRKTTPYLDRLGDRVASEAVSLTHRPSSLAGAAAFDNEGFPNTDVTVVVDGVLEHFLIDWYSSHKLGRAMTTGSTDFEVAAGDSSLADIIGGVTRGILLGRYSGGVPNQNLDFSGVAKNSFYVENGRVVGPITETMVAGNLGALLADTFAVSREQLDYGYYRMPWLAASGVTISTK